MKIFFYSSINKIVFKTYDYYMTKIVIYKNIIINNKTNI